MYKYKWNDNYFLEKWYFNPKRFSQGLMLTFNTFMDDNIVNTYFLKFFKKILFLFFREERREKERETSINERYSKCLPLTHTC